MQQYMHKSLIITGLLLILCSCSLRVDVPLLSFSGTFAGNTEDNRPIKLTLTKSETGFNGHGTLDGKPISISILTSQRGLGVITYNENILSVSADLSFDGNSITLIGLDKPVILHRDGSPVAISQGPFTGRFISGGIDDFIGIIELVQNETLVVGTGSVFGQTVALSGIIEGENNFKGRAIFTDGSEAIITAQLSEDGRLLKVKGLAGPLEFRRQ